VPYDIVVFRPSQDRKRREFSAIVGDDHAGLPSLSLDLIYFVRSEGQQWL
jgi:hypothetical protein